MNSFFIEKIQTLGSKIPSTNSDPAKKLREAMRGISCQFKIQKVDIVTVLKIIKSLKNSSATGVDYVDTRTLKLIADKIAPASI